MAVPKGVMPLLHVSLPHTAAESDVGYDADTDEAENMFVHAKQWPTDPPAMLHVATTSAHSRDPDVEISTLQPQAMSDTGADHGTHTPTSTELPSGMTAAGILKADHSVQVKQSSPNDPVLCSTGSANRTEAPH